MNRDIIVVIGMHRSGTSLTGQILSTMGVQFGSNLVPPDKYNPEGYFEDQRIVETNEEILTRLDRNWTSSKGWWPYPPLWWKLPLMAPLVRRLEQVLEEIFKQSHGLVGIKDPRITRMLPLWTEVMADLQIAPRYVLCVRHPLAVAMSIANRDGLDIWRGLLLWLVHYAEAMEFISEGLASVVVYENWFSDSRVRCYEELSSRLGLKVGAEPAELSMFLQNIIKDEHRHYSSDRTPDFPFVMELYNALRESSEKGFLTGECYRIARMVNSGKLFLWGVLNNPSSSLPEIPTSSRASVPEFEAQSKFPLVIGEENRAKNHNQSPLNSRKQVHRMKRSKKRVCIVTDDIIGPINNGGIGTAFYNLSLALTAHGYEVTILYVLGKHCETGTIDQWIDFYRTHRITFVPLDEPMQTIEAPDHLKRALSVYRWLARNRFDIVHFHEWRGRAYYATLAKRQGLNFTDTVLSVSVHSPTKWHLSGNGEQVRSLDVVEVDYMEQQSVLNADVIISPTEYMFQWMLNMGWKLPSSRFVLPNVPPLSTGGIGNAIVKTVNEIVFFGRLEARKGLHLFCDALDELHNGYEWGGLKVTFLGKSVNIQGYDSKSYIMQRASRWTKFEINILDKMGASEAINYLRQSGKLAVILSVVDNAPYTVVECLHYKIPFIAAGVGGIPELIHPEDRERVLVTSSVNVVAKKVSECLKNGAYCARPVKAAKSIIDEWINWHDEILANYTASSVPMSGRPLVSVCLVHHDRPQYLREAIHSLKQQDYPNFEVVIVDDGSRSEESHRFLAEVQEEVAPLGWRVIKQPNRYLGAARNTGAAAALGEYILFMDDDNIAKPNEISVFVKAAQLTQADILTCFMDVFSTIGAEGPIVEAQWTPLGGCAAAGVYRNCFGDANALVRRSVWVETGGFTEDYGVGHEDWEFFAKAVLAGYTLSVVPEALFWYRRSGSSMLNTTDRYRNYARSLRPYLKVMPDDLKDIVVLAQAMYLRPIESSGTFPGESPQQLFSAYWTSTSWRLTRPLRNFVRFFRGLPAEPAHPPSLMANDDAVRWTEAIRSSNWWDLTGPFRVVTRVMKRLLKAVR